MEYLPQYQHIHVFAQACAMLRPNVICDIGSFDGTDAQILAQGCPNATVIAFEANPENFFELSLSERMLNSRLTVQHIAISDSDGMAEITVPGPPADASDHVRHLMRGMGSMLRRPDIPESRSYTVPKRRLDGFFGNQVHQNTFALWVDVEGHTKSMLAGAHAVLSRTILVKLELETVEYWEGQALAPEIIAMMQRSGFELLVTSDPAVMQMDALFIRQDIDKAGVVALIEQAIGAAAAATAA